MANRPVEIEFLMRDRLTGGMNAAGGSVDAFGNKIDATTRRIQAMGAAADGEFNRMDRGSKRLVQGAAAFFTVKKGSELVQNMIRIREERQMLEGSLAGFLQDETKAQKMLLDFQELSLDSPIEMGYITRAGQTLMGFGVDAENVMPILRQLSDVSMGNQQRFEALALAYAQCQSAGRLMGQDLLQMINAGFNPLQVISDKTGKSIGTLKDEMGDGKVSAEMVADAFKVATSEGGRFYGMAEKMTAGIRGARAELTTTIVNTYNEIGEQNEDMIAGGYKMATALVKNYEPIIKTLGILIATYGTYKAAMIATNAYQGAARQITATIEAEELRKLLPVQEASKNADLERAVAKGQLTRAQATELAAVRTAIAAKLNELKTNQTLALSEQGAALAAHRAALQRASASRAAVLLKTEELALAQASGNAIAVETAEKALQEAVDERHIAVKARKATADTLAIAKSRTAAATTAVETMQTKVNTAGTIAATKAKNLFAIAGHKAAVSIRAIGVAIKTNPLGIILTAIMAITTAISLFSDKTKRAEDSVKKLAEAGQSLGDASIVDVANYYAEAGYAVVILTGDEGLKAYEPRNKPMVPRRRAKG